MTQMLQTLEDLEIFVYSNEGARYIQKADAPILSTTTGVYNAVYGAQIWRQLNQQANAFGLMPKYAFPKSGWRVIPTRGDGTGRAGITSPSGGLAEGATLPDTQKPGFQEVETKFKEIVHTFDTSTRQEVLANSGDDAVGDLDFQRQYWGIEHKEQMDAMLLGDVATVAGDNLESLDRVASSFDEVTNLSLPANSADIYGLDRDAGVSFADAVVNDAGGTDRPLTDALIRTQFANQYANGSHVTLLLTGHDTYSTVQGLYNDQARYNNPIGAGQVKLTVNGVETVDGTEVGMNVATVYGVPLFRDVHVFKDGSSRMYFLDTSNPEGFDRPRLGLSVGKPTMYFESRDLFVNDRLASEGLYYTGAELICTFFGAQGKIRDLS